MNLSVCLSLSIYMDHKTSLIFIHRLKAEINKLSIDVWFVRIGQNLYEIQLF